jgi:hypothetical protein
MRGCSGLGHQKWSTILVSEQGATAKRVHYDTFYNMGDSIDFIGVGFDTFCRANGGFLAHLRQLSLLASNGDMALHAKTLGRAKDIVFVAAAKAISDRIVDSASRCLGLLCIPSQPRGVPPFGPFAGLPPPVQWYHPLTAPPTVDWAAPLPDLGVFVSHLPADAPSDGSASYDLNMDVAAILAAVLEDTTDDDPDGPHDDVDDVVAHFDYLDRAQPDARDLLPTGPVPLLPPVSPTCH